MPKSRHAKRRHEFAARDAERRHQKMKVALDLDRPTLEERMVTDLVRRYPGQMLRRHLR
ncbi:MAG: hypothetical protein M0R06_00795 [Sphaerochaeta sp.]|jgi:hypothetical protein|nr:hypothetical protein [Sphaerochaeta sp.]